MRKAAFILAFLVCAGWAHRVHRKRVQVPDRLGSAPAEISQFDSEAAVGRPDPAYALANLLVSYNNPAAGWRALSSPVRKSMSQVSMNDKQKHNPNNYEFSRTVTSSTIKNRRSTGITKILQNITATPEECAALAKRFGYVAINSLECTFHHRVVYPSNSRLRIRGTMEAEVETESLGKVKLEKAKFEEWFKEYGSRSKFMPKMDVTQGIKTEFSELPLLEDRFDMGELCAQHLGLAITKLERAKFGQ